MDDRPTAVDIVTLPFPGLRHRPAADGDRAGRGQRGLVADHREHLRRPVHVRERDGPARRGHPYRRPPRGGPRPGAALRRPGPGDRHPGRRRAGHRRPVRRRRHRGRARCTTSTAATRTSCRPGQPRRRGRAGRRPEPTSTSDVRAGQPPTRRRASSTSSRRPAPRPGRRRRRVAGCRRRRAAADLVGHVGSSRPRPGRAGRSRRLAEDGQVGSSRAGRRPVHSGHAPDHAERDQRDAISGPIRYQPSLGPWAQSGTGGSSSADCPDRGR